MKTDKNNSSWVLPGSIERCLHIMTLTQLVIAWPLYDLLSRFPEFFVARQAQPGDIVFLTIVLSLAIPLLLAGIQVLVSKIATGPGKIVYSIIIYLLFLMLGHLIVSKFSDSAHAAMLAAILALAVFIIYVRSQAGKLFVSFLSPAIVIIPFLFVINADIRPLLRPVAHENSESVTSAGNLPPVFFIVFDEFPINALLDADGLIDAGRFPNFSAISRGSYWYPNATSVATSTVLAIPAMLTGRYPDSYRMPHHGEYPDNLFTWLGADYDLNVHEAVSAMCPASLCSAQRLPPARRRWHAMMKDVSAVYVNMTAKWIIPDLPVINQSWEGFWGEAIQAGNMYEHRLQQLDAFVDSVQITEKPGLDFLHINFPHIPYEYLPSGRRYNDGWLMPGLDFASNTWVGTQWQSRQAYQRFQMQVRALDSWLGKLIESLKDNDLYERSLIILTSDHGVSFEPASGRREAPPLSNLDANILPVPLIIKVPFQTDGHIDPRNAELIDILPTIAQVLEQKLPWQTDGVSLLGDPKPPEKRAVLEFDKLTPYVSNVARVVEARASSWIAQKWQTPAGDLIGQALTSFEPGYDPTMHVRFSHADYFQNVDPEADFLPAYANGEIAWHGHTETDIAFVLNGKIVAVSRSYEDNGVWKFSAMLPESAFQAGKNTVEVVGIISKDDGFELIRGKSPSHDLAYTRNGEMNGVSDSQGPLIPGEKDIAGEIDYISKGIDSTEVLGWCIDAAQKRAIQTVLIFDENKLVWQGNTQMLRDETHQFGTLIDVGFLAVIPNGQLGDQSGTSLRIYAVSDDRRVKEILLSGDH